MSADEMFEELGYIKDTKTNKILLEEINDEKVNIESKVIVYWKEHNENKNKVIMFNFYCKTVGKSFHDKEDEDLIFNPSGSFTKDEIVAINKKIEELQWN